MNRVYQRWKFGRGKAKECKIFIKKKKSGKRYGKPFHLPKSGSFGFFREGDVLTPGGCFNTESGTSPSGGESTEPEVGILTRHQSGEAVFTSRTSTCCPLWTVSSWDPGAATWSPITQVISTTGWNDKRKSKKLITWIWVLNVSTELIRLRTNKIKFYKKNNLNE